MSRKKPTFIATQSAEPCPARYAVAMNTSVAKWKMIAACNPWRRNRYPIASPARPAGRTFHTPYPGAWASPKTRELAPRKKRAGSSAVREDRRLIPPPTRYRSEPRR